MQISTLRTDRFQGLGNLVKVEWIFTEWKNHKLDTQGSFWLNQVPAPVLPNF